MPSLFSVSLIAAGLASLCCSAGFYVFHLNKKSWTWIPASCYSLSMALRKPPPNDAQLELFSAIFSDIASRDSRDAMEYPFLSLSKKPRFKPIEYICSNGTEVTVSGGEPYGIANIWDYDLIIWLLSQLRQAMDDGIEVSRKIRFTRYGYLKDVRRHTGGDEYRRLEAAIARLKNTTVATTIRAKKRRTIMFSWIEFADIERDEKGKIAAATVVLPEWLYEAVCDHKMVLTLHPDYFLLQGGYARWLYRLIKKSAGNNVKGWRWKFRTLHERSGTLRPYKRFAEDIRKIAKAGTLLDYSLSLETVDKQQYLHAVKTAPLEVVAAPTPSPHHPQTQFLRLSTETFEKARRVSGGYDVYALYEMWKEYNAKRQEQVKFPDAAFIGFCKKHTEKNPIAAR